MTLGLAYGSAGGAAADLNSYIRVTESTTDTQLGAGTGSGTKVVVDFDTVDENTDGDNYSLTSEVVTVLDAGEYRIEYMLTYVNGASAPGRRLLTFLEVDPNTGTFAAVDDSLSWNSEDGGERSSTSGFANLTLVASSKVRLASQRDAVSTTTNVNRTYTHMTITRLRA